MMTWMGTWTDGRMDGWVVGGWVVSITIINNATSINSITITITMSTVMITVSIMILTSTCMVVCVENWADECMHGWVVNEH